MNRQPASLELLESRQLLSAKISLDVVLQKTRGGYDLMITGTPRADRIGVKQDSRGIVVTDGIASKLIKARLRQIIVNGGAGNDLIGVHSAIQIPAALNGQAGHDIVVGGSGKDAINGGAGNDSIYGGGGNDVLVGAAGNDSLYGNDGKDFMVGGAGDDVLVSLGGGRYDTLEGDGGFDSFWTDNSSRELVTDKLSGDENYNGAWHRIDGFIPYFDKDGDFTEISIEPLGQDLPDPEFDFDENDNYTADGYEDWSDYPLFAPAGSGISGPHIDDVEQGNVNDCFFLATLAAAAEANPDWIRQSVVSLGDGTFAVRFMDSDGGEQYVRVDGELPFHEIDGTGGGIGGIEPAYAKLTPAGEATWVAIMEKAFAYWRDPENVPEDGVVNTSYHNLNRGWLDEPMIALGGVDIDANDPHEDLPFADGDELFDWIVQERLDGRSITLSTRGEPADVLLKSHAYTVLDVVADENGQRLLKLRNPWATDGPPSRDGKDDGYVFITADEAFASAVQVASGTI